MATLPISDVQRHHPNDAHLDDAAKQMTSLIEEYFDKIGLSEDERDARYGVAREYLDGLDAKCAANAKA